MRKDWVNNKYIKERIVLKVEAILYYRIKKHRKQLISLLRKEIKHLDIANGNVKVKKVDEDWAEELIPLNEITG